MQTHSIKQLGELVDPAGEDALVEYQLWKDTGCSAHPRCLECPLPVCAYEMPGGLKKHRTATRNAEVIEAWRAGATAPELAVRFGLNRRTIFHVLEQARRAS